LRGVTSVVVTSCETESTGVAFDAGPVVPVNPYCCKTVFSSIPTMTSPTRRTIKPAHPR
jgi:hypothetical protein